MEIDEDNQTIFRITRLFGMAPFTVNRIATKGVTGAAEIRLGRWWCAYSVMLIFLMASLTVYGLINDSNSTNPVRMKTATSRFVTSFDIIVVVGTCLIGCLCGCLGLQRTRQVTEKLKKADNIFRQFPDVKDACENYDKLIMTVAFGCVSVTVGLDIICRYCAFKREMSGNSEMSIVSGANSLGYIPFYLMYYIFVAVHVQFATTALGVRRRYWRLNTVLLATFPTIDRSSHTGIVKMVNSERIKWNSQHKFDKLASTIGGGGSDVDVIALGRRDENAVNMIASAHSSLGDAVEYVSSAYGFALLAMLVACLLHLVGTAWNCWNWMDLSKSSDPFFSILQFVWLTFHLLRLLLIVEPCHLASVEARRTNNIVCEIIRNCNDHAICYNFKKFWRQLLAERGNYFSACGMSYIDRQILTSFSGALTTYLVILIQFQKTDG